MVVIEVAIETTRDTKVLLAVTVMTEVEETTKEMGQEIKSTNKKVALNMLRKKNRKEANTEREEMSQEGKIEMVGTEAVLDSHKG